MNPVRLCNDKLDNLRESNRLLLFLLFFAFVIILLLLDGIAQKIGLLLFVIGYFSRLCHAFDKEREGVTELRINVNHTNK